MKSKFKEWFSTNPLISRKRTIISSLRSVSTQDDIRNLGLVSYILHIHFPEKKKPKENHLSTLTFINVLSSGGVVSNEYSWHWHMLITGLFFFNSLIGFTCLSCQNRNAISLENVSSFISTRDMCLYRQKDDKYEC